ncbi:MAG TPA: Druantia anti-phage system protein DruA [Verrucomicrobiae bacterium]|nr:Druantia anti-phage system protein DruA [Verrucomicrobiae bacterium]
MEQHSSNISELKTRLVALEPKLGNKRETFRKFCRQLARRVEKAGNIATPEVIAQAREDVAALVSGPASSASLTLQFCASVVVDIVAQGWTLKPRRQKITLEEPKTEGATPMDIKQRIRAGHLFERDAQLREPAVVEFVKNMEQRRLGPNGWVSIFSLMRDGRELASKLKTAAAEADETKRVELLAETVSPYVQAVETDAVCSLTGLRLTDIWRYFRHTWVSTYKSLPGRSMLVLIRDAAAPNHPVIGIAALGSSMAQQTERDQWIGWDSDVFIKKLHEHPTAKWCRWVHESVERLLDAIYKADLIADGNLQKRHLTNPTPEVIEKLTAESVKAAKMHQLDAAAAEHKRNSTGEAGGTVDWKKQALTWLFRSKRAKTLALLLGVRRNLREAGLTDESAAALKTTLESPHGKHAIRQLVRLVKAEHVGVDMMDIIICGAVAPYNTLLGGKLVCMMLTSPEVVRFYRTRYGEQASIIASSMKGDTVIRSPNLVLLATTSLYGVGSSQYNRVRVPVAEAGGKGDAVIEYEELGMSRGYGSYHFSKASIDYLETLMPRGGVGRKVNSIFGEGVNPLMRKLRDGLAHVGLPAEDLLMHGNPRVVYGIPIAENFREVLLGVDSKPKYFLALANANEHTAKLGAFWRKRWLAGRIARPGILDEVEKHTLSYPVTHGARVRLPSDEDEANLFQ